jgi:trans-L-3-hydroxyproline dehydratase
MADPSVDPPEKALRIGTVDMHTGGEPLRVIMSGLPAIEGDNVLQKRRHFKEHLDHLRTGLMFEPRGHADMYGAVLSRAQDDADFDVFFLHNEGYSTMCGHAIIALTKLVVEAGMTQGPRVSFNVPAGRIDAIGTIDRGIVSKTSFRNVPSFVLLRAGAVEVPGIGRVPLDVAYGGAFYAIVDAEALGLRLTPQDQHRLIDIGRRIKHAVIAHFPIEHPFEPDLSFLYGTIFTGPPVDPSRHSRNVCIFADGEVDRSATGSGVSARAALHHARGELALGHPITIESILGTTMTVKAVERVQFGRHEAIVPEVSGAAYFCGRHEFWFEPKDPLAAGFLLR